MNQAKKPCVLVTGGTGKIGKPVVQNLLDNGWEAVLIVRDLDAAQKRCDDLAHHGNRLNFLVADLSSETVDDLVLEKLQLKTSRITAFFHNARDLDSLAIGQDGRSESGMFHKEFHLAVTVPYRIATALAGNDQHDLTSVLLMGSQYGVVAPNPALYGGTLERSPIQYGICKAAAGHLAKELAVRIGPKTRVNCLALGGVRGRVDPTFEERYAALTPSRRMLDESDVPGPVKFLLSDDSRAITGQTIVADGGWSIW